MSVPVLLGLVGVPFTVDVLFGESIEQYDRL